MTWYFSIPFVYNMLAPLNAHTGRPCRCTPSCSQGRSIGLLVVQGRSGAVLLVWLGGGSRRGSCAIFGGRKRDDWFWTVLFRVRFMCQTQLLLFLTRGASFLLQLCSISWVGLRCAKLRARSQALCAPRRQRHSSGTTLQALFFSSCHCLTIFCSQFLVAQMLETGRGVVCDIAQAVRWYSLAAAAGHAPSGQPMLFS
jgi:hypothetical protein